MCRNLSLVRCTRRPGNARALYKYYSSRAQTGQASAAQLDVVVGAERKLSRRYKYTNWADPVLQTVVCPSGKRRQYEAEEGSAKDFFGSISLFCPSKKSLNLEKFTCL